MGKESERLFSEARMKARKAEILNESPDYEDRVRGKALAEEAAALFEKAEILRQTESQEEEIQAARTIAPQTTKPSIAWFGLIKYTIIAAIIGLILGCIIRFCLFPFMPPDINSGDDGGEVFGTFFTTVFKGGLIGAAIVGGIAFIMRLISSIIDLSEAKKQ